MSLIDSQGTRMSVGATNPRVLEADDPNAQDDMQRVERAA